MTKALFLVNYAVPVITSNGGGPTATVDVNIPSQAVTTVVATPGPPSVVYSISGGADAALFTINATTGALTFLAPSVEGSYAVTVRATNERGHDDQALTVDAAAVYMASAIHAGDYTNGMAQASPTIPDSSVVSGVLWAKVYMDPTDELNFWACGNDVPIVNIGVGETDQFGLYSLTEALDYTTGEQDWHSNADTFPNATWVAVFYNQDTQNGTGQFVVNDTVLPLHLHGSQIIPFDIPWAADTGGQKGFQIPRTGAGIGGGGPYGTDMADPWITTSHLIDWTIVGNRRKFQDGNGKPVFLGDNGEIPFGYSPEIFFSGTADDWVNINNRGTCGAFVLLGVLTDATSSPSD